MNVLKNLIYLLLIFALSNCSSLLKIEDTSKKSDSVKFSAPGEGFLKLSETYADRSWRHESDGSTISFLSDCHRENEPTITSIQEGVVRSVENKTYISKKWITYNERKAYRTLLKGSVDGIDTQIDLTVLKKNGCIYSLTYISLPESFGKHKQVYEKFFNGFVAQ